MHIEDINIGDFVTVLRGQKLSCPVGCCEQDSHQEVKGIPFMVTAIQVPYVMCALWYGGGKVFDTRECELMAVSQGYFDSFKQMCQGNKAAALVGK